MKTKNALKPQNVYQKLQEMFGMKKSEWKTVQWRLATNAKKTKQPFTRYLQDWFKKVCDLVKKIEPDKVMRDVLLGSLKALNKRSRLVST